MDRPRHAEVAGAIIVGQCSIHKPDMHCGGCEKEVLQAEIAGRRIAPPQEAPAKGALIRDFQLSSAEGKQILLSGYRGQFNMVLILAGESKGAADFLSIVQRHQTELAENEPVCWSFLRDRNSMHLIRKTLFTWISRLWLITMGVCIVYWEQQIVRGILVRQYSLPIASVKYFLHIASRMTKSCPDLRRSCPRLTSLTGNVRNVRHQNGRIDGLISKVTNEMKGDEA